MTVYAKKFVPFSNIRKSEIFLSAKKVCQILQGHGFQAYLVGGCVRDLAMKPNKIPKDIDVATSATVEQISNLFKNTHFVGNTFGVCLIHMNSFSFEVASFRKEGKYQDRRRPESVTYANFSEDSNRRDFTINALYYDTHKKRIIDFHGGLADIQSKKIRCVGKASARLYEDSLRILRLCRFAADFGFSIEEQTLLAAKEHAPGIALLPQERILLELNKVKNFNSFVHYVIKIVDLSLIFKQGPHFFHETFKQRVPFSHFHTQYPLFNFIKQLSFNLKMDPKKLDDFLIDIQNFPTLNKDKKLCREYLNFILFEHLTFGNEDEEHTRFVFYIESLRIQKIVSARTFKKILRNMKFFISQNSLKDEIAFLNSAAPAKKLYTPKEISEQVLKNGISNIFIQTTIDFIEYTLKKNKMITDLNQFILENIDFIKKVAQR